MKPLHELYELQGARHAETISVQGRVLGAPKGHNKDVEYRATQALRRIGALAKVLE